MNSSAKSRMFRGVLVAATLQIVVVCGVAAVIYLRTSSTTQVPMPFTSAEKALGQKPMSDPTIANVSLIDGGVSITKPSRSQKPKISEAEARRIVESTIIKGGDVPIHSCVLVDLHDSRGNPPAGTLVWLVDITPPNLVGPPAGGPGGLVGVDRSPGAPTPTPQPQRRQYLWVTIDATTGQQSDGIHQSQ